MNETTRLPKSTKSRIHLTETQFQTQSKDRSFNFTTQFGRHNPIVLRLFQSLNEGFCNDDQDDKISFLVNGQKKEHRDEHSLFDLSSR